MVSLRVLLLLFYGLAVVKTREIQNLEGADLEGAVNLLKDTLSKFAEKYGNKYELSNVIWASKETVNSTLHMYEADLINAKGDKQFCRVSILSLVNVGIFIDCSGEDEVAGWV